MHRTFWFTLLLFTLASLNIFTPTHSQDEIVTLESLFVDASVVEVDYTVNASAASLPFDGPLAFVVRVYDRNAVGDSIYGIIHPEYGALIGYFNGPLESTRSTSYTHSFPLMAAAFGSGARIQDRYFAYDAPLPDSVDLVFEFVILPQSEMPMSDLNPAALFDLVTGEMRDLENAVFNVYELPDVRVTSPEEIEVSAEATYGDVTVNVNRLLRYERALDVEICRAGSGGWYAAEAVVWTAESNEYVPQYDAYESPCSAIAVPVLDDVPPANVRVNIITLARGSYEPQSVEDWRAIEPLMQRDGLYPQIIEDAAYPNGFYWAGVLNADGVPLPTYFTPGTSAADISIYAREAGVLEDMRGNWELNIPIPDGDDAPYAYNQTLAVPENAIGMFVGYPLETVIDTTPRTSVNLFDYHFAYLVTPDAVAPEFPAQMPETVSAAFGAEVFTDWDSFASASESTTWDTLIIHASAVEWLDAAVIRALVEAGTYIYGVQIEPDTVAGITGGTTEFMTSPDTAGLYKGFYTIAYPPAGNLSFKGRMEHKGDWSWVLESVIQFYVNRQPG